MAKIKEITVSTKRTQGLPGYSSISKEALVTLSLEEGEEYGNVYKHAWELVNKQVELELSSYVDPDWITNKSIEEKEADIENEKLIQQSLNIKKIDIKDVKIGGTP
jgi:hypothetical protein